MSEVKYKSLHFDEAIAFFRDKLNVPTEHFDDLVGEMHAKGFMVAGAMKAELISDLRGAVDKVIAQGGTLEGFRKDFDKIVADHGWRYKGGRNWRTRVIYHTNLRQAYNAGRWGQLTDPDVVKLRPYLMYRHSGSAHPRKSHLALNSLVLEHDDPFWNTHAPQNGWGCNCRLDSLSRGDLKRMGKAGPDTAPKVEYREHTDRNGVASKVPVGVDPGFDYNVGKARDRSYKSLAGRMESLDTQTASYWVNEGLRGPVFKRFFEGEIQGDFPVAALSADRRKALGGGAQMVWLSEADLGARAGVDLADYMLIPKIIAQGEIEQVGNGVVLSLSEGRLYRMNLESDGDGALHVKNFTGEDHG